MACSCQKRHKGDLGKVASKGIPTVALPHSILPGASCIFCAEKHLSVALSTLVSRGVDQITRQIIIGELECARRHTFYEYPDACKSITSCLTATIFRADTAIIAKALEDAVDMVAAIIATTNNGQDATGEKTFEPVSTVMYKLNPLIGELYLSAAWRLSYECGYQKLNRPMIIGDLSMAQLYFFKFDYDISERIRNMRHAIQRLEYNEIKSEWVILAQNIDIQITPAIASIKKEYGEDLSWYFGV